MEKEIIAELPPNIRTSYEKWLADEGIDVITGYHVEDLRKVPLKPWKRKGGLGVFINLEGSGQTDGAYICEIPPGKSLNPQKHLFEELIFVLDGQGTTTLWNEGGAKQIIEWQEGSLFSPPLNTWHQHFNGKGNQSVKYVAVTTAPTMMNLIHNLDFIFNNPYNFTDRYNGEKDYFSREKYYLFNKARYIYESSLIKDVRSFELKELEIRGKGSSNITFEIADNVFAAHITEMPVARYMKAHYHRGGAHVIILNGHGYTLMWKEGYPIQKFPWQEGSLLVPPENWFHQHFNMSNMPARFLALRWSSIKYKQGVYDFAISDKGIKEGGRQIEYKDEDPIIRKMYEEELAKSGVKLRMD